MPEFKRLKLQLEKLGLFLLSMEVSMLEKFFIRKVAVLGAGVMGAQIGAHFANAGIPAVLFDLKAKEGSANAIGERALANLRKIHPNPLASEKSFDYLSVANYDDDLAVLEGCDLIIEAIAERLDWKVDLFHKIAPHLNANAIVASNTSGLSIEDLAAAVPASIQPNFCGIHFFNPPRYMPLIELIPQSKIDSHVIPMLETFLVSSLGKSVIEAKDTPNFIANRIGVFAMIAVWMRAVELNIPFEIVDQLTAKNLGRASSATFRTVDVVGLDTFEHIINTMKNKCADGFEQCYIAPEWLDDLIKAGALGSKTKVGIFRKDPDGFKVYDKDLKDYRPANKKANPEVIAILKLKTWGERFNALHASTHPEAQLLWASFRDLFHYCAILMGQIADTPRDVDFALRWGFAWHEGPFEIWQQGGWSQLAQWIAADIAAGKSFSTAPLPEWVFKLSDGVYVNGQHFDYQAGKLVDLELLPVYQRQLFPDLLLNEKPRVTEITLYEDENVHLWHSGDNIGVLSIKSKMCAINRSVLQGIEKSIEVAEERCQALVIWQDKDLFSAGANLADLVTLGKNHDAVAIAELVDYGHQVIANKIRYSTIPVVAGVKGVALGGGCEIMLHCDAVVAALESTIGLVEEGVGLLPGWGGTTEMVLRANQSVDPEKALALLYTNLITAKSASSAREAQEIGFLRAGDTIVMNSKEVLLIAKARAHYLAVCGYRPQAKPKIVALGREHLAKLSHVVEQINESAMPLTEYEQVIATKIAEILTGGDVAAGSAVSEDSLLLLERERFVELLQNTKTQQRIDNMLAVGKVLHN